MTETELTDALMQIERQRLELLSILSKRQTSRAFRRQMKVRKNDQLMRIVVRHYVPHAGYIDWGFKGDTLVHSGKYIKYPKNSNRQRWIKRASSRRVRNSIYTPQKGNYYRRLFDYWWTLY